MASQDFRPSATVIQTTRRIKEAVQQVGEAKGEHDRLRRIGPRRAPDRGRALGPGAAGEDHGPRSLPRALAEGLLALKPRATKQEETPPHFTSSQKVLVSYEASPHAEGGYEHTLSVWHETGSLAADPACTILAFLLQLLEVDPGLATPSRSKTARGMYHAVFVLSEAGHSSWEQYQPSLGDLDGRLDSAYSAAGLLLHRLEGAREGPA